jgi:hypothetical protein
MNKFSPYNKNFVSFDEFIDFCKISNIKSGRVFDKLGAKRPTNIPSTPRRTYKSVWKGWPHITGNAQYSKKDFTDFTKFVDFCERHNVKSHKKFMSLTRPNDIPSNPHMIYKKKWKGWAYITKSRGVNRWMSFKEARTYMRKQNLTARTGRRGWLEWEKAGNRPHAIPSNPYTVYGKEWTSWPDFLDTDWTQYPKSKLYAIASKVRLAGDWTKKGLAKYDIEKPGCIPLTIKHIYPKQWEGMRGFLGTKAVSYDKFIDFLVSNNIRNIRDLRKRLDSSPEKGIKRNPSFYYRQWPGWISFRKTHYV